MQSATFVLHCLRLVLASEQQALLGFGPSLLIFLQVLLQKRGMALIDSKSLLKRIVCTLFVF